MDESRHGRKITWFWFIRWTLIYVILNDCFLIYCLLTEQQMEELSSLWNPACVCVRANIYGQVMDICLSVWVWLCVCLWVHVCTCVYVSIFTERSVSSVCLLSLTLTHTLLFHIMIYIPCWLLLFYIENNCFNQRNTCIGQVLLFWWHGVSIKHKDLIVQKKKKEKQMRP